MSTPPRFAPSALVRDADIPRRLWRPVAIVGAVGFLFLLIPRLTGWVGLHVHKEDGLIFLADFLDTGWASLGEIYSGYLHVLPRLIAGICAALPAEAFPTCVLVTTSGLRVWFFVIAAAVFLAWVPTRWKWAVAAAAVFLFFGPGQHEAWGNITNLRWFGVGITGIALMANFRTPAWSIAVGLTTALAVLADPIAIGFVPIAVWRVLTSRRWGRVAPSIFLVGAILQATVIRPADRGIAGDSILDDPVGALVQGVVRGITVSQYGTTGTSLIMLVGGIALALVAALLPLIVWALSLRRDARTLGATPAIVYLLSYGVATLGATFYFASLPSIALDEWWAVQQASRYSALASLFFTPALILAAAVVLPSGGRWQRVFVWLSMVALLVSVALDIRGDSWNTAGPEWPTTVSIVREECGAGATTVTAPLTPAGTEIEWVAPLPCDWVR